MNFADVYGNLARPRVALPLIVGLGLLLYFTGLGHPMYTFGEPREGVTAIDVVNGHGFILPNDPLVEMPFKPPMMRWLASLFAELAGGPKELTELTMRLPSATLGIGGVLVCYAYGAALFEPIVGLAAALMLGTSIQYLQAATNARVDMTFTFFLEVAFFEFILIAEGLTSRWLLLYLAVAGAVLSKGPVGVVLPAGVTIIWSVVERRRLSGRLHLASGLMVVALVAGGWYVAAIAIGGSSFVLKQLVNENFFAFFRSSTVGGGHNHSFLWLDMALVGGWLPWSPFLPWVAADLGRKWPGPRFTYLIIWVLVVVFFYSLAHQKRGIYLLAIYPALALLTANLVRRIAMAPALPRLFPALGLAEGASFAMLGLGALALVALTILRPATAVKLLAAVGITVTQLVDDLRAEFVNHPAPACLLPILTLLLGLGLVAARSKPLRLWAMTVGAMSTTIVTAQLFVVPAIANAITLKHFTEKSMRLVDHHPVAYLIGLNYEVAFYSRRQIAVVGGSHAGWPDYLLADSDYYHSHAGELAEFGVLLQSGPANLDGGGAMILLRRQSSAQPPKPASQR